MRAKTLFILSTAVLALYAPAVSSIAKSEEQRVNLMLSTLPAGKDPQRYKGYIPPKYPEVVERSLYVTMRDGVRVAIAVVLPKPLANDERIPTIMNMTRYWRAYQDDKPQAFFPSHGYAQVFVDARGTGASFGVWRAPFSPEEIKDYGEVVDWIVKQPWSNGNVGAIGNSYEGNTALWLAVNRNPAVKAVIPRHFEFDEYSETPFPGGLLTNWLIKAWNDGNHQLDHQPGVKLVDEDTDQHLYREAIKSRPENLDVYGAARKTTFRDDQDFGVTLDEISLHTYSTQIEESQVAINSWGGWFDASTADAVLRSFMTLGNYQRAVIGPWNHGGGQNASPYPADQIIRVMQGYEWLRFFDHYLKGIDTGLDSGKLLYYFTIGEGKWKSTNTWPLAGSRSMRWFLNEGNLLSTDAPASTTG